MELMQRQLDDDLSESEIEVLMSHTRQCPDCAAMFERLQLLSAELTSLPKVTPSYSLVDAIMPQLERLELFGHKEEEQPVVIQTEPTPRRAKRECRWPSIRVVSGVVAAGIVAGLFLVTYKPDISPDFASMKISMSSSDDSAANSAQEEPKAFSLKTSKDDESSTPAEVTTEALGLGDQRMMTESESLDQSEETDQNGQPSSGSSGLDQESSNLDNKGLAAGGASGSSDGFAGEAAEGGIVVTTISPVISPDGKFAGHAVGFKLEIIAQADQSIVFTAPRKNGELINLVWSEDSGLLTYEVHVENGATEKYEIDLATLTEKKAAY
ncbi:anti-sigma factor family protein [Paenibacillus sinopodophylli]|uniref:anti-sigma factor family protein n=1 Tax=Paenibacillus sinopodophylli TaxID=1837342 RepID=UPI002482F299|nr:zf-HC2 domain-containing protein [Paenibacillus sinopodophylli]